MPRARSSSGWRRHRHVVFGQGADEACGGTSRRGPDADTAHALLVLATEVRLVSDEAARSVEIAADILAPGLSRPAQRGSPDGTMDAAKLRATLRQALAYAVPDLQDHVVAAGLVRSAISLLRAEECPPGG